jgi:hypothetical protein
MTDTRKPTETRLRAEMGDKKYKAMVEKSNKDYDKYKAGKRNPKTGEYYYHLDSRDPNKPLYSFSSSCVSEFIAEVKCKGCDEMIPVSENTSRKICLYCNELNFFSIEFRKNLKELNKLADDINETLEELDEAGELYCEDENE